MSRFAIVLFVILAGYWLALSGYFKPMLLSLGLISILTTLGLCYRMRILDSETVPYTKSHKTLSYFVWLFREIAKANMTVVRAVLKPDMEISPTLVTIPVEPNTDLGRTMFANSITLTPGTVSMDLNEDGICVHALLSEMADPNDFVEMGRRSGNSIGEAHDLSGGE